MSRYQYCPHCAKRVPRDSSHTCRPKPQDAPPPTEAAPVPESEELSAERNPDSQQWVPHEELLEALARLAQSEERIKELTKIANRNADSCKGLAEEIDRLRDRATVAQNRIKEPEKREGGLIGENKRLREALTIPIGPIHETAHRILCYELQEMRALLAQAEERERETERAFMDETKGYAETVEKLCVDCGVESIQDIGPKLTAAQAREQRLLTAFEELIKELEGAVAKARDVQWYQTSRAYKQAAEWAQAALVEAKGEKE